MNSLLSTFYTFQIIYHCFGSPSAQIYLLSVLYIFQYSHDVALTPLSSVFVTTHIISSYILTLASLTTVHSEVCWLVSLEPCLLHSRPIDLDFVWVRALSDQHLINSQCT